MGGFRRCFWSTAGIFFLLVVGCSSRPPGEGRGETLMVAVTIPPQKWLVERIGGGKVSCFVLIPQNQDPHTYSGTDADGARLARCRVFFTIGLPIEKSPWCQALQKATDLRVVSLAEGAEVAGERAPSRQTRGDEANTPSPSAGSQPGGDSHRHLGHGDVDHAHEEDVHIWLDPVHLIRMGEIISGVLSAEDPANAALYEKNWQALRRELDECHRDLQAKLAPLKGESFFVFHAAWGSFARRYGLMQEALEVEGREPSDEEITALQRKARQAKVKVMLVQPQISSRAAAAVAEVAGLKVVTVNPLTENVVRELQRVAQILVSAYREREEGPVER